MEQNKPCPRFSHLYLDKGPLIARDVRHIARKFMVTMIEAKLTLLLLILLYNNID